MASRGHIKPEQKINGIELKSATTVTSSLRGRTFPSMMPIKLLVYKKGQVEQVESKDQPADEFDSS